MKDPSDSALNRPEARPSWLIVALVRLLLRIFFRQVEVIGAERMPRDKPVMVVANHGNALVDPAMLIAFMPVCPRFLGASYLWGKAILRPFLRLAAAIPVYRRQDAGADTSKNEQMFAACHRVLHAKNVIGLFPEGTSHHEPELLPLKTGVSRIVLEASRQYADEHGEDLGAVILPVGLTFDEKGRFRSRALVLIGEPVDIREDLANYTGDNQESREAVRSLTERVDDALRSVTLNFPSWELAPVLERAAQIFAKPTAKLPAEAALSERFAFYHTFIEGYAILRERCPKQIDRVRKVAEEYDRRLGELGLKDVQVASAYPSGGVVRYVLKSLFLMTVRGPLAILGTIMNFLPYRLVGTIARRLAVTPELPATYKLLGSLVLFPVTWALWAAAAWFFGKDYLWGLLALVVGPLSGAVALLYHERQEHLLRQARAFFTLRSGSPEVTELRRMREDVLAAVRLLAQVYREEIDAAR